MFNFWNWATMFAKKTVREWWKNFANSVKQAIMEANQEHLGNDEKRELVVDKLNAIMDIPYIPDWLEGLIIRGAIEMVYELIQKELGEPKKLKGL